MLLSVGPPEDRLRHWLAAEGADRGEEAETALASLFAMLPIPQPSAAFADRVLINLGLETRPAAYPWWSRAMIAVCLLLAGLTTAYAFPLIFSLAQFVAPGEVAGMVVQTFVGLASQTDELLAIWRVFARVVNTALLVATSPQVVVALLSLTVFSVFTLRGLNQLLSPSRSSEYVQAL